MSRNAFLSEIQNYFLNLAGIDKTSIKTFVFENAGPGAWELIAYVTNPSMVLMALLPCLFLEKFFPARSYRAYKCGSLALDYLYPIIAILVGSLFVGVATVSAAYFYKNYVPWLNIGILDGQPLVIQILGAFLIVDLALYWSHRIRHEIPWLWHFHVIHHSQHDLNPATT